MRLDELPLAFLSILWRLAGFTRIRSYQAHDKGWRSSTFASAVMAHGGTWTTWVMTAFHFASTVGTRPASMWVAFASPVLLSVAVVVVFAAYTARGPHHKPSDVFMGAPLLGTLPSASNLLVFIGIVADVVLLGLKSGWMP